MQNSLVAHFFSLTCWQVHWFNCLSRRMLDVSLIAKSCRSLLLQHLAYKSIFCNFPYCKFQKITSAPFSRRCAQWCGECKYLIYIFTCGHSLPRFSFLEWTFNTTLFDFGFDFFTFFLHLTFRSFRWHVGYIHNGWYELYYVCQQICIPKCLWSDP